jgi:hypothetical protein
VIEISKDDQETIRRLSAMFSDILSAHNHAVQFSVVASTMLTFLTVCRRENFDADDILLGLIDIVSRGMPIMARMDDGD